MRHDSHNNAHSTPRGASTDTFMAVRRWKMNGYMDQEREDFLRQAVSALNWTTAANVAAAGEDEFERTVDISPALSRPLVATVTLTPIGADMTPADDAMTITLDHQANIEVVASVMRLLERRGARDVRS